MILRLWRPLAAVVVVTVTVGAASAASAALIYRSDFGSSTSGFAVVWTGKGNLEISTETPGLLRINSSDAASAAAGVRLEPGAGRTWRISVRAKHELVEGSASLVLQCFSETQEQLAYIGLGPVPRGRQTKPIERLLRLPPEAAWANLIVMHNNAAGTVWLADVRVETAELDIEQPDAPPRYGTAGLLIGRDEASLETATKLLLAAGFDNARGRVDWRTAERERGGYDFSDLEEQLESARRSGIRVPVVFVNGTPPWAHGKDPAVDMAPERRAQGKMYTDRAYWAPADWGDWARFLHALFTHFKGRVPVWEIINEPDMWTEGFNGTCEDYLHYLRIAYLVGRRVDPSCRVFCGAILTREWFEELLERGGADYCHGFCIHPYGSRPAESVAAAEERILNLLDRGIDKPFWVTEIGFQSGGWPKGPGRAPDELTKAQYGRSVLEGLSRSCEMIIWYRSTDVPRMFGLLEDRSDRLVPLPVYYECGDATGRLPRAGGPIGLTVHAEPEPAAGRKSLLLVEATNTSSDTLEVRLLPVGITADLAPGYSPRSCDWTGMLKPGGSKRIEIPLVPTAAASGEYLVGAVAVTELANTVQLAPLSVVGGVDEK